MVKRVITFVFSAFFLLGGALFAIGGGVLMAVVGSDSSLSTSQQHVSTPTSALVTPIDNVEGTTGIRDTIGQPRIQMSVTGAQKPVFIGVGPASAVDSYLAGAAIDRVLDLELDPFSLRTERRAGTAQPGQPDAQTFWVAKATGSDPAIDWKIRDGSYRLVIMNADASPGVAVNGRFELVVPHLFAIAVGILIAGIVGILIGITLLVLGVRMSRRPAGPGQYPPGPGQYPSGPGQYPPGPGQYPPGPGQYPPGPGQYPPGPGQYPPGPGHTASP
jgi:hypothetical protein